MKTSTYLKSGLATLSVAALIALSGCGGSSGTSSISGTVQASIIKGATVCIAGTTNCATTDANGRFTIAGFAPPQTLEIKVGNSVIGSVSVNSATVAITPKLLADGNTTLAPYIGLLLHEAAGCNITDELCDLSGVTDIDINQSSDKPLIEELKEALDEGNTTISLVVDGNTTKEINETEVTEYETENPEMTSDTISYAGAANVGDFATFSYNTDTHSITYHVHGSAFGDVNGTKQLTNLFNNIIFKDSNNNFYFFSGSLGVAAIDINSSHKAFVIGLQTPPSTDTSLIINKTFNYIEFNATGSPILSDNGTQYIPNFKIIRVYATSSNTQDGNWTTDEFNLSSGNFEANYTSGTWELNGTHLDINDSNGLVAHAIIRPPIENGRAGFLVDLVGDLAERGFGIGIEAKEHNITEIEGTYYYYDVEIDNSTGKIFPTCYGTITVTDNNDSNLSTGSYIDKPIYCENNDLSEYNGTITLNPYVQELNTTLYGVAQTDDLAYIYIDPVSGYFIRIYTGDGTHSGITFGSNKPIEE